MELTPFADQKNLAISFHLLIVLISHKSIFQPSALAAFISQQEKHKIGKKEMMVKKYIYYISKRLFNSYPTSCTDNTISGKWFLLTRKE